MYDVPLKILYTNYKGETSIRNIVPQEIYFGKTDWHPKEQWLLQATDVDKGAVRTFAIEDIDFIYGDNDAEKLGKIKRIFDAE
ncbi:MAG TPA: hypothetical protein DIC60_03690 [Lachnospiraceae bacterium]|nr:hypothetical protein [Lachnospiraceae bacterium]